MQVYVSATECVRVTALKQQISLYSVVGLRAVD